jgi:hypothetical protein
MIAALEIGSCVVAALNQAGIAHVLKDLDDVRDVIAMQGNVLDWEYIQRWVALHKTKDKLERAIASIPPRKK